MVGVEVQAGDLVLGVGDLLGPAQCVHQVRGGVGFRVGDHGLDFVPARPVGVGVGDLRGLVEPVGDRLDPPVELRVVIRRGVVRELCGVVPRVGDPDHLDVLVALQRVVAEPERLGQGGVVGAVDHLGHQALVGVPEVDPPPGDIGDVLDLVDDLRVGQVRTTDFVSGVVDERVALALGVVVQRQRLPAGRVGQVPQELRRLVGRAALLVGEQHLVAVLVDRGGLVALVVEEERRAVRAGHHPRPGRIGVPGLTQVQVHPAGWS